MKKIYIFAISSPANSSPREKYRIEINSHWTPSGLDIHWSKDLSNWNNYFLNRD